MKCFRIHKSIYLLSTNELIEKKKKLCQKIYKPLSDPLVRSFVVVQTAFWHPSTSHLRVQIACSKEIKIKPCGSCNSLCHTNEIM